MDVYNAILEGISSKLSSGQSIESYLNSLKKSVKSLRVAYRNNPVFVNYEITDIQAAYLATYLPH